MDGQINRQLHWDRYTDRQIKKGEMDGWINRQIAILGQIYKQIDKKGEIDGWIDKQIVTLGQICRQIDKKGEMDGQIDTDVQYLVYCHIFEEMT